jgi:alginate O-acetyltransferase complex protein AlgI
MFLAGVWHGAGFQFIIFGLLHGVYLTTYHAWKIFRPASVRSKPAGVWSRYASAITSVGLTFLCVLLGQLFFRATSTHAAFLMMRSLLGGNGFWLPASAPLHSAISQPGVLFKGNHVSKDDWFVLLGLAASFFIVWFLPNTQQILGKYAHRQPKLDAEPESSQTPVWKWQPTLIWAAAFGIILLICLVKMQDPSKFLYFQF